MVDYSDRIFKDRYSSIDDMVDAAQSSLDYIQADDKGEFEDTDVLYAYNEYFLLFVKDGDVFRILSYQTFFDDSTDYSPDELENRHNVYFEIIDEVQFDDEREALAEYSKWGIEFIDAYSNNYEYDEAALEEFINSSDK